MALSTLVLPPDQSAYTVTDGNEVISVKLDGGASRFRRDILGAVSNVTVQWSVGPDEYRYLRAFYKTATSSGATPFLIDLLLDFAELTQHTAYFVPGSMRLQSQKGLQYIVAAQLEAKPNIADEQEDWAVVMEYELNYQYGEEDSEVVLNLLAELVNFQLPEGLEQQ